ncbi:hypothetical protein ACR6A7_16240 [Pantoea sp. RRHST58]|uniref:hypothetical protein n=1 Tax=Pantoea sp. RRHST58 TaxID=3425183 RepID=UPI003DA085D7
MTSSAAKVSAGLGLAFLMLFNSAFAAPLTPGGSLTFSGAIAQDPCQLTPGASRITFACRGNNGVHTQQIGIQQVAQGEVTLPGVEKVSLTYLNPQKSKAVVRIDYH